MNKNINSKSFNNDKSENIPKYYNSLILILITLILFYIINPLIYMSTGITINEQVVYLLIPTLMYTGIMKFSFKETFLLKVPKISHLISTTFISIGSFFIIADISVLWSLLFPDYTANIILNYEQPLISMIFINALIPSICEELLFRGFILTSLKDKFNIIIVSLIVGLIFGLFHLDLIRFFPAFVIGTIISLITIKTGSVFNGIVYHFINNLIVIILPITNLYSFIESINPILILLYKYFLSIIFIVAGLILFFRKNK